MATDKLINQTQGDDIINALDDIATNLGNISYGEQTSSDKVVAMTGYEKASTAESISQADTLNEAIGKLEKRVDLTEDTADKADNISAGDGIDITGDGSTGNAKTITNTGVYSVENTTNVDTTAVNGDIRVVKKTVSNGVTSEVVSYVKPKGISAAAFKSIDNSTSGLTADDNHVPTSKAVIEAIDEALASASIYQGTIAAFNDLPTSTATVIVQKGWYYRVSTAWAAATGTPAAHVGDIIIAEKQSPSKSIDGTNWSLLHNEMNTDANVTQSPVSTNANYEVLFSGTADNTSHTEGTGKDSGLTYNPSTNKLTVSGEVSATSYSGLPEGNTTTKGIVQLGTDADKAASGNHVHGNITNGGALQTTDVSIASGDKLVITDASDSNKVARASVSFDGSTATQALTKKGTFESFQAPISASNKLSSDFVDDTNKTHRFATADQLTQIATNKTNILYGLNTGVKNKLPCAIANINQSSDTGISCKYNDDGSYTITGTKLVSDSYLDLGVIRAENLVGSHYASITSNGTGSIQLAAYGWNGTGYTLMLSTSTAQGFSVGNYTLILVRLRFMGSVNTSFNAVVKPMICTEDAWNQSTDFMPPALPNYDLTRLEAEDRIALAEVVDSGAKNVYQVPTTIDNDAGLTITTNPSTGTITVSGTATKDRYIQISNNLNLYGTYIVQGCPSTGSSSTYYLHLEQSNEIGANDTGDKNYAGSTNTYNSASCKLYIRVVNGVAFGSGVTFTPMICTKAAFGVSQKFVPYRPAPELCAPANRTVMRSGSIDDISITSYVRCSSDVAGLPTSGVWGFVRTDFAEDGVTAVQQFTSFSTTVALSSQVYVRVMVGSTWQPWKALTNT